MEHPHIVVVVDTTAAKNQIANIEPIIRERYTHKQDSVGTLDFDARVPIPFSVFPSSYRNDAVEQQTVEETHVEAEINLPHRHQERVGREGEYSSVSANPPPQSRTSEFRQEEVHITREEDRQHRPSRREDIYIREERRPQLKHTETHIDVELPHQRRHYDGDISIELPRHRRQPHETELDLTERQYRAKFQPSYREEVRFNQTVDPPRSRPTYREETRVSGTTVDAPRFQQQPSSYHEEVRVGGSTVDPAPRFQQPSHEDIRITQETVSPPRFKSNKMGYYDEDGHYHSFRHGLHRAADKLTGRSHHHHHHQKHHDHIDREDVDISVGSSGPAPVRSSAGAEQSHMPNTVTIPCHHIRLGDLLILQGRPCQVIRITTSSATGQHRYLGVDLFTKQLHEESSFIANPSPSVVVQTMLGPVFKQYRVLDLQDGTVVAMTETGDVKQSLPVIDQSNLWARLSEAFETGRGSVRVQVISDNGRELAVDMKTIHGSRL
ncbi:Woronin body major protein [Lachnellula subtilissima]|uniref:Woronin body major protein n=1 Tax=Lachnellula subtilissima TaxID=602034 RepID=A0A8H8RPR5_9HELO|nr:Woronin body major protein [Lachnellula subtilissima]